MRLVFKTGAAQDPLRQAGAAWMTASMLAGGGSRTRSYKEIIDAFFPMGVSVGSQVDKEMICFAAEAHIDHLERFYVIFRDMLLDPGWRADDFERLRDDTVNYLEVELRGQNDEELAKEVLYQRVFAGHPYERHNAGTVASLRELKIVDLREFYLAQFAQENLTIALAGGYPEGFNERARRDFTALPLKARSQNGLDGTVPEIRPNELFMIEKPARGVAISLGFPIEVKRGHADYPALLLATSALGQHRMSSGRLFTRMRQLRGLNYGDYSYIEHFPGGMYTLEPSPNLARSHQIFQLWIRPVEREQAHFALRLALHELERLVRDGLSQEEFERTRSFLSKYVNLLLKTKEAELGYAIDSEFYGIGAFPKYLRDGLKQLTLESVNDAIRSHLRWDQIAIVMAGEGMGELRDRILANEISPMTYNSPKPDEILEEDRIVERRPLAISAHCTTILPVEEIFS